MSPAYFVTECLKSVFTKFLHEDPVWQQSIVDTHIRSRNRSRAHLSPATRKDAMTKREAKTVQKRKPNANPKANLKANPKMPLAAATAATASASAATASASADLDAETNPCVAEQGGWRWNGVQAHESVLSHNPELTASPTTVDCDSGRITLNPAYTITHSEQVEYDPSSDSENSLVFQCGWVLDQEWVRHLSKTIEQSLSADRAWRFCLSGHVRPVADCVYQLGLYACTPSGAWEVVQTSDQIWEATDQPPDTDSSTNQWDAAIPPHTFPIDSTRLCNTIATYRNSLSSTTTNRSEAYPTCVLGVVRVDMGQLPHAHTLLTSALHMEEYSVSEAAAKQAVDDADARNRRLQRSYPPHPVVSGPGSGANYAAHTCAPSTVTGSPSAGARQTLASIRSLEQLRQPFAVLPSEAVSRFRQTGHRHFVMRLVVHGTVSGVEALQVVCRPVSSASQCAPSVHTALVENGTFALSVNEIFATDVGGLEFGFHSPDVITSASSGGASHAPTGVAIDITQLRSEPVHVYDPADGGAEFGGTTGAGASATTAADFAAVDQMRQDIEQLRTTTRTLERTPGPVGATGKRGAKGERGDPLRFEDLSDHQKEELRGKRGLTGPQGKPMVFEDLSPEQRQLLRGEKGDRGERGETGERGACGEKGACFTFEELTEGQRQLLKGDRGVRGDKGEPLTFEELTEAQKAVLRGEKGERGQKGDMGERGERGRVGPTGAIGPEGKPGPRGLPGIPGSRGERGETGEPGADGSHGRPAVIKTAFPSVELLHDFVSKSLNLSPNTYFIIDQPTENTSSTTTALPHHSTSAQRNEDVVSDHGKLFVYTGEVDVELTVGCTYTENLDHLFKEYNATVRASVQSNVDEWRMSITLRSEDISVYHLRRGLENSIIQGGYAVKDSNITDDALQHVGRLCGVQGRAGERGERGDAGLSMLGMRLDYIGVESTRLSLKSPEPNSIFLQIQSTKTHEAGFYLFDAATAVWKLLHGVDMEHSFLQWMQQFVENPNQESVPLVLSMLATTQKHMEGQYGTVKQELQEYRATNEKWKKYQFEHWKSMGNSQYQQFNTKLTEHTQLMDSVVQQVNGISDRAVNKDELGVLRTLLDKHHETLDRKYKSLRESITEFTERQTVDKHVFEQEQDAVQSRLRDMDTSTLKMLKIIQYLKTAPWNKPIKQVQQDMGKGTFTLRQELMDTIGELRELVYAQEQSLKAQQRASDKRMDTLEQQAEGSLKKMGANTDALISDATSSMHTKLEHSAEKLTADTDKKILQTVDALQQERAEKDALQLEAIADLRAALKETAADLSTSDQRWADKFEEQRTKTSSALHHHIDRARTDFAKSLREAESHNTDNLAGLQHELKQHHTQQTFDTKTLTKRLADVETTLSDDIERKVSAAKTHTDEKTRELEQRHSNVVQVLTGEVQNVDAKCTNVDYMLKARLESVEEHIQQLHNEGLQHCETLLTKQQKDTQQLTDKLRDDVVQSQQRTVQALTDQLQRSETSSQDHHTSHTLHLERLDAAVLDVRKTHDTFVQSCANTEAKRVHAMDEFKNDVRGSVRELLNQVKADQDKLSRQLQETKRELRAQIDSKFTDVRTELKQADTELEDRTSRKHDTHNRHVDQQLAHLRSVVEGICKHVDSFAQREAGYREQHEARLQQVVGLLEKTFTELQTE